MTDMQIVRELHGSIRRFGLGFSRREVREVRKKVYRNALIAHRAYMNAQRERLLDDAIERSQEAERQHDRQSL